MRGDRIWEGILWSWPLPEFWFRGSWKCSSDLVCKRFEMYVVLSKGKRLFGTKAASTRRTL